MKQIKELYIGTKMYGHDASIFTIFPETQEIFAISAERLTRYKHDKTFPIQAFEKMVEYMQLDPAAVTLIRLGNSLSSQVNSELPETFYEYSQAERDFLKAPYSGDFRRNAKAFRQQSGVIRFFQRMASPAGRRMFALKKWHWKMRSLEWHFQQRLQKLFPNARIQIEFFDHETCHAASAYYFSPFDRALSISLDGMGDGRIFSRVFIAENGKMNEIGQSESPDVLFKPEGFRVLRQSPHLSLGIIYLWITSYMGYEPNSDEGKVEALAAFGNWDNPLYHSLRTIAKVSSEKGIQLDSHAANTVLSKVELDRISASLSKEDMAAAVQKFTENTVLDYLRPLMESTGIRNICLSGGVVANVIVNLRIFTELGCQMYVVPAMGDDGSSQGAAVLQMLAAGFSAEKLSWLRQQQMPYWGTSYTRQTVGEELQAISKQRGDIVIEDLGDTWPEVVGEMVCAGKVGALFHGRMEWGPRALGNRSLIADPRNPDMREILNRDIKRRPLFQPFCPSILAEDRAELFEHSYDNKHMTVAFEMRKQFWASLPGAVHVDGTARAQFVSAEDNPNYHRVLKKVKEIAGFGILLNTSFNKHGRTIAESVTDAVTDFADTSMDFLMIEGFYVKKKPSSTS